MFATAGGWRFVGGMGEVVFRKEEMGEFGRQIAGRTVTFLSFCFRTDVAARNWQCERAVGYRGGKRKPVTDGSPAA